MILSDDGTPTTIQPNAEFFTPAAELEKSEPVILEFIRLFRRDIWCWIFAVQKLWWLFAIFPLLFACTLFLIRTMTTTNIYVANCGLIRQEMKSSGGGILPPGYVSVQKAIIMNLFKTRAVLEETVKRLSLPYSAEQLYNNIRVQSDKNSDYFLVSATSKDPTISAALANTLADVFIEEYKKLIRRNLEDLSDSFIRTQNDLEKLLAEQDEQMKKICAENNLTTIENDIAFNNQRLLQVEDRLTRYSSQLDSAKQALVELQGELAITPEEVVTSREKSTVAEEEIMKAEHVLQSYEQMYAKGNPLLIQQRNLVKKLKEEQELARQAEEEGENSIDKRVTVSRNPTYTRIQVAIAAQKADISSMTNNIRLDNDAAVQLRARRELLATIHPILRQLEVDIQQTKDQINSTKERVSLIRNFLDRSFSDISIQELAKAPHVPLGRKRTLWGVIGLVLGTMVALIIILVYEFFNLTIRSNVDVEQALKIKLLGMIPVLNQAHRADYYSALQAMTSNGKPFFSKMSPDHPLLIVFAPNKRSDIDEKMKEEFCETLKIRLGCNYVVVSPLTENDLSTKQMPLLINDYLYQFSDEAPIPGKDHTVFFNLDELSFVSPLADEQIQRIKTAYKSGRHFSQKKCTCRSSSVSAS